LKNIYIFNDFNCFFLGCISIFKQQFRTEKIDSRKQSSAAGSPQNSVNATFTRILSSDRGGIQTQKLKK
jgi:hypothetical protein